MTPETSLKLDTARSEKPMLFSGAMVRASLAGTKTQTRRVMKPQPPAWAHHASFNENGWGVTAEERKNDWCINDEASFQSFLAKCPYGKVGDQIWVKETFAVQCAEGVSAIPWYRADYQGDSECDPPAAGVKWKPSIFMPRKASRITLEIVSVRVERLQEITAEDAIAEGLERSVGGDRFKNYSFCKNFGPVGPASFEDPVDSYWSLWESINGNGSWDKNPYVWVIEFKKL